MRENRSCSASKESAFATDIPRHVFRKHPVPTPPSTRTHASIKGRVVNYPMNQVRTFEYVPPSFPPPSRPGTDGSARGTRGRGRGPCEGSGRGADVPSRLHERSRNILPNFHSCEGPGGSHGQAGIIQSRKRLPFEKRKRVTCRIR